MNYEIIKSKREQRAIELILYLYLNSLKSIKYNYKSNEIKMSWLDLILDIFEESWFDLLLFSELLIWFDVRLYEYDLFALQIITIWLGFYLFWRSWFHVYPLFWYKTFIDSPVCRLCTVSTICCPSCTCQPTSISISKLKN